jgi:hypothetical protein
MHAIHAGLQTQRPLQHVHLYQHIDGPNPRKPLRNIPWTGGGGAGAGAWVMANGLYSSAAGCMKGLYSSETTGIDP